ncbi:hypothetical protein CPL00134L_CDS0034 [Escherichia phage Phagiculus]
MMMVIAHLTFAAKFLHLYAIRVNEVKAIDKNARAGIYLRNPRKFTASYNKISIYINNLELLLLL